MKSYIENCFERKIYMNKNHVSRKYRVLHLIDSGGLYGAERVILNLSLEMRESPFISIVGMFTNNRSVTPELGKVAKDLGIQTSYIPLRSKFNPLNIFIVINFLKKNRLDIIHSHGYKPTILAYLPSVFLKIPLISTCHLWFKEDWKLKIYYKIESMVIKHLPVVTGVSEEICHQIVAKGVDKERVKLIHNGINIKNYGISPNPSTVSAKKELNIKEGDFVIGTVGRLAKQKSHYSLLNAMKILNDMNIKVKCIIIGDGYLRNKLEKEKSKLGLNANVFFLGFREDVLNLITLMDVFIMTSLKEGFPMALLEAMALKKPIISTPVGDVEKLLQHGENGLVYQVGDIYSLVDHITALKKDREYRLRLGNAAYEKVLMDFTSKSMTKKYLSIYTELLDNQN